MNETKYTKSKRSVCSCEVTPENFEMNKEVYLPVCNICKGTEREQRVVEKLQDSLADWIGLWLYIKKTAVSRGSVTAV